MICGAALALTLVACDENAWNDEYLKGFEEPVITKKETVVYDMTSSDIKKLVNLTANKALAEQRGESAALAAVGENGFFTAEITPEHYAPAWLDSLSGVKGSPVYYLSEKSTLKLNFPTSDALPEELTAIQTASNITVGELQYQDVWGSETDYVEAFTPSKPAAKFLPEILTELADETVSNFAVVTYNVAQQDPVFGGSGQQPEEPAFEMSSVVSSITLGGNYTINGVVSAICKQGYILSDLSGSILVYYGSAFDMSAYAIGQQRTVSGKCAAFGGCLQISSTGISDELVGVQEYTYPTPIACDGAMFEQYSVDRQALKAQDPTNGGLCDYVEIQGATFTQSGNYINFTVPGADQTKAEGSGYQLPAATISILNVGNPVTARGYIIGCSGKAYVTFLVTEVDGNKPSFAPAKANAATSRGGVKMATTEQKAVYKHDGTTWSACTDVYALNATDYEQMGVKSNLTATQAATFLPIYMSNKQPYAQEGATYYVVYNLNNGDTTVKNFCSRATYTGTEWALTTINNDMMQFVRAGKGNGWSNWVYDPSIYIDLPGGRGASSAPFWQACVDWVYEHIDVPQFGSTSITSGIGYVTSFGNNDYFCGASAYQCNVDLRVSAARKQTPSVYKSMSDEEVVATIKDNFQSIVMPAVLAATYPDAQPGKGVDLYYVISFVMYNGSSHNEVIRYLVSAPGTFEYVDCTWNDED